MTDLNLKALSDPFPLEQIHWRAQNLTKDGDRALALAYLDARDVMDRLDEVCGPANWSDRYEFHGTRTICYLSIRLGEEWVTKADGAGDSAVEAEKGSISDALKRAAVKWGVGRYLYNLGSTWVACESYERSGKKYWKKWKEDPWSKVQGGGSFRPEDKPASSDEPAAKSNVAPMLDYYGNPREASAHYTAAGRRRGKKPRLTDAYEISSIMDALLENMKGKPHSDALKAWLQKQMKELASLPDPAFDEFMDKFDDEIAGLNAERLAS